MIKSGVKMRPKKERIINAPPEVKIFKPAGIPGRVIEKVFMTLDEYEAIRLADYEKYDHEKAAEKMEISRPTFTRLIDSARKKVADAIINGKELIIEGGNVHFKNNILRCPDCGYTLQIPIYKNPISICPSCGSERIVNFAKQYGHGRCCRQRWRNRGGW